MNPSRLPSQQIEVARFSGALQSLYEPPDGITPDWPPVQLDYLESYLDKLGCKTIVVETHYIDRDYIEDLALFYARAFQTYPNYCARLHFFKQPFDINRWRTLLKEGPAPARDYLQPGYLGFSVVRPLPVTPVGRTVLATFPSTAIDGTQRNFGAIRNYEVHVAGVRLDIAGLAFQQQDRGVSACATTALWTAMQGTCARESLTVPTPAQITEAASRYVVGERSLPSEGLSIPQMCEAIRASGLAPLIVRSSSPENDRAQLWGYLKSGFAPILAIRGMSGGEGHAVTAVGLKEGPIPPQTDPALAVRDASMGVQGVYLHDDRLGPYATARLYPYTRGGSVSSALEIRWPEQAVSEAEHSSILALIVPVPIKLRLTVGRIQAMALWLGQTIGESVASAHRDVVTSHRFEAGWRYRSSATNLGLSDAGAYRLACEIALPRYVGLIEFTGAAGPLCDLLLDATATIAEQASLCLVLRDGVDSELQRVAHGIAATFGIPLIS